MSTLVLGKNAVLSIGASSSSQTTVTGAGDGFESVTISVSPDTTSRNLKGFTSTVHGGFTETSVTVTCKHTSVTAPVFRDAGGKVRHFTLQPEGTASGKPKWTGNGPVDVSLTIDPTTGTAVWSATIHCDGAPTRATN